ncbi:MAG: acylphosphatase [Actinobacteria bacterium]|nr:acylphosphatase [Actinomycetota bacterium]
MMNKNFELVIEGRVQGVGMRYFAYTRAIKYNISGFVKNTPDGNVEIVCSGESAEMDKFIAEIKKGPSFSFISDVRINETPQNDFKNFEIRY